MLKLLGNKDVLIFMIEMMFRKWKKDYITKGGWMKPKNLLIKFLREWLLPDCFIHICSDLGHLQHFQGEGMVA